MAAPEKSDAASAQDPAAPPAKPESKEEPSTTAEAPVAAQDGASNTEAKAPAPEPDTLPDPRVELARGDQAVIEGLKATELNGFMCSLFRFDEETGRWEIKLSNGEVKALKPCHLAFRAIGAIEDDGSLTLISMASDNVTIHRVIGNVRELIRMGSEALALLGSVVAPTGGRRAIGEEARIWLKLAKQAEQRVRGALDDLQKNVEQVDAVDASRYGPKIAAEIRMARKDLVQFVQKAQEQLEAGLRRLKPVMTHLVATVPAVANTLGSETGESLHEKYRAAFQKLEENVVDPGSTTKKSRVNPISVRYQGRGENPPPSDNLYVKGLPGWVTEADIEAIFAEVGEIQSMKLKTADWGAIAFVRLASKAEAERGIAYFHNSVPRVLEKREAELEAKRLSAEVTKGMLRATVDQLARGIIVVVDLRRALGCVFNDFLVTKTVQEDGQGFALGIRPNWRVRSVGGVEVQKTTELKDRMAKLIAQGMKEVALVFSPPPIVASFEKRPMGFTVAKDSELGLVHVSSSTGVARAYGIRPGAIVANIGGTEVSSLRIEHVRDMLKEVTLPITVHFEQARGMPNTVAGMVQHVPEEEQEVIAAAPKPEEPRPPPRDPNVPMVVPPPVDIEVDLSIPLGIVWYPSLVAKSVKPGSQAARLGIGPGWEVLGFAGEEVKDVEELEKKLEALKAEGCLGQSMMFQPAPVPATQVKTPSTAADAAAMLRERAATVAREEEEARQNMREVPLELDLSQPLGILFNKTLEADSVTEGSQASKLGVEAGWRAVSLAGETFTNTRDLVAKIQALKAEGTTTVAAVFAAPSAGDAEMPQAAPEAEGNGEKRPPPAEEFREITMDLSQPLGISFTDDVVAKEVKEGSQAHKLGVGRLWKLTTAAGASVSTAKELVAKIKGLKSEGAAEVILRFAVAAEPGETPAKKARTE